jgi:hypothetical protein
MDDSFVIHQIVLLTQRNLEFYNHSQYVGGLNGAMVIVADYTERKFFFKTT